MTPTSRTRALRPRLAPTRDEPQQTCVSATHDLLFAQDATVRCDACGAEVDAEADDGGFALAGEGEYVWARGEDVRREPAPLCQTCATAVFGAAVARWEIEDEEG